jgi:hypothetical protein
MEMEPVISSVEFWLTILAGILTIVVAYVTLMRFINKKWKSLEKFYKGTIAEQSAKVLKIMLHISIIIAALCSFLLLSFVSAYISLAKASTTLVVPTTSQTSVTTTPQDTVSPTLTTDTAIASPSIVATATIPIAASTPLKTIQTLCVAAKAEDYPKQWDQFDPGFRTSTWAGGYTEFSNGLTSRDNSNGGVASCTFTFSVQSGSSARATETTTFNNGTKDIKTLQLIKEGDGVWKINNIIS